ncbi:MAG: iron ABC transporter permease [Candidatus Omnitrophota bacterium]
MDKKILRWIFWITLLSAALLGISLFSLCTGPAAIPVKKVFSLLFSASGSSEQSIIVSIRLPRILLGLAVGGALSLAGVILQGMFRNPLVEPYTLGISGAAALGVCLGIVLRLHRLLGPAVLPLFGFSGALSVIAMVYILGLKKGTLKIEGLLLIGVMVSFITSSLIMLIMALARSEDLQGIIFWVMGSLQEPSWLLIKIMLTASVSLLLIAYFFCLDLNALSLGEEEALHLGINVEKTKRMLFIIASLLTGFSVSVAGIIGFVGLAVPHFVRLFTGNDHRVLLVGSFLSGAAFLIFCDTLARTIIAPLELPVGVITGIIGGSLFIYTLAKRKITFGER